MKNILITLLLAGGVLGSAGFALAQEEPPEPNETNRPPARVYVVAAPRAAFIARPVRVQTRDERADSASRRVAAVADTATEAQLVPRTVAEAFNFARPDGRILLREGHALIVRFGRGAEAVWYEKTVGHVGSFLALSVLDPATGEWDPVGWDGVTGARRGPRRAHLGRVHVPVRPLPPGEYVFEARIWTLAKPGVRTDDTAPEAEEPAENAAADARFGPASAAFDRVRFLVRVVDAPTPEDEEWEQLPPEPNTEEFATLNTD